MSLDNPEWDKLEKEIIEMYAENSRNPEYFGMLDNEYNPAIGFELSDEPDLLAIVAELNAACAALLHLHRNGWSASESQVILFVDTVYTAPGKPNPADSAYVDGVDLEGNTIDEDED